MFKAILLIWILVSPGGQPAVMITQYPSLEKCESAADDLDKSSAEEVKAGHFINYMGGCFVKDLDEQLGST